MTPTDFLTELRKLDIYEAVKAITVGVYGAYPEELVSRTKERHVTNAKAEVAYFLKAHFAWSQPKISRFLGVSLRHSRDLIQRGRLLLARRIEEASARTESKEPGRLHS